MSDKDNHRMVKSQNDVKEEIIPASEQDQRNLLTQLCCLTGLIIDDLEKEILLLLLDSLSLFLLYPNIHSLEEKQLNHIHTPMPLCSACHLHSMLSALCLDKNNS